MKEKLFEIACGIVGILAIMILVGSLEVSYDVGYADGQEIVQKSAIEYTDLALLEPYFPDTFDSIVRAALRNGLTPEQAIVLYAIRKAENGPEGLEFGVMSEYAKNTNLDKQAGACSYEIKRHCPDSSEESIIAFGKRYCPVGAENDPDGLNKNWSRNVIFWVSYYKEVIRKAGEWNE